MIAIDSVIVVPSVFASPAGLSPIASPLSADATAAPARDVEIAPEPGRYIPPACAALADHRHTTANTVPLPMPRAYRTLVPAARPHAHCLEQLRRIVDHAA